MQKVLSNIVNYIVVVVFLPTSHAMNYTIKVIYLIVELEYYFKITA